MQNSSSGGTCLSDTRCAGFFALVLIAFAPYHGNHRHRIDKYLYTIGTININININIYYFLTAKGWIKSTCTRKHIKEIHTDMSNTANVIDS